jgi:PST family polysaccharide transporter
MGNIYRAVMNKELQLDKLSSIDIISTLTATLTACFLARSGVSLWALVALVITEQIVRTILIAIMARIYPPELDKNIIVEILDYGRHFLATTICSRLSGKISDISIGSMAGSIALGFFQRASMVLGFLNQIITSGVIDVAVPLFGKLQDSPARLSRWFEIIGSLLIRVTFCAFIALAISMNEFISILYGPKWLQCVGISRLLLPYMLIQSLNAFVQNTYMVTGKPSHVSRIRMIELAILVVLLFPMLKIWHANGAAIALDISSLFAAVFFWTKIGANLKINIKRIFAGPIIASMAGVVVYSALMTHLTMGNAILSFVIKNIIFIVVYSMVLLIIEYEYLKEIVSIVYRKMRE